MKKETENLLKKMSRVIESAGSNQKEVAGNWVGLANRRLNRIIEKNSTDVWAIVGASYAIRHQWETKFGRFTRR